MAERPGIMFYFDDWTPLLKLDDHTFASLVRAALQYGKTGEAADFEGTNAIFWEMIAPKIDRDGEAYSERCRKARYSRYKGTEKAHGREPLEYEEWIDLTDNQPTSTNVNQRDQYQFQNHQQFQNHPQEQGQGEKQGNQKGVEGGRDFPAPYKPLPVDDFEKQREERMAMLKKRSRGWEGSPYSSCGILSGGCEYPEDQPLSW